MHKTEALTAQITEVKIVLKTKAPTEAKTVQKIAATNLDQ